MLWVSRSVFVFIWVDVSVVFVLVWLLLMMMMLNFVGKSMVDFVCGVVYEFIREMYGLNYSGFVFYLKVV